MSCSVFRDQNANTQRCIDVKKTTRNYGTKFEKAQIIGYRAMQLALNDPPMVETNGCTDMVSIAGAELQAGKLNDLILRRYFPDGSQEDWRLSELVWDHL